jgi:hypothetical protein
VRPELDHATAYPFPRDWNGKTCLVFFFVFLITGMGLCCIRHRIKAVAAGHGAWSSAWHGLHPVPQGPGWVGLPRASVSACCLSRQRTQRIILTHQGPQSNGEADTLANKSCLYFSLARRVWFINPPEGMCNPVSIYIEGFCLKKPKNATHHPYACIALRCVPLAPLLAALCFEAGDEGGRA